MLALRPEVLDYIVKTHGVSAEQSTLAQIRSACEDFEQSNEYRKQLAATQARLGGSKFSKSPHNSTGHLHHDEYVAHVTNDSLPNFAEDRDWTPNHGPRGQFIRPIHLSSMGSTVDTPLVPSGDSIWSIDLSATGATANAQSALSDDFSDDPKVLDSEVTAANASLVTP